MENNTFHKLCYEFDLNYKYNDEFIEYCDNLGIMSRNFYGVQDAETKDKKTARDFWKKNHKVWFKDLGEVDAWIDAMPMGGYKNKKEEQKVLAEYRKNIKNRG